MAADSEPPIRRSTPFRTTLLASALPLALLAFATFYSLGDLGRFNDDYFYLQRDLATWKIRSLILDRPFHVWRPLFQVVVPALQTLFWDHNWVLHLISTLTHGLNAFLLFRLLSRLGIATRIAAASSVLYTVYPGHFEAVFWSSCIPTLLATALLLWSFLAHLSWLESPSDQPRGVRRLYPLLLAGVAFSIAALNEQPAGPLAILPFLFLLRPPAPGVTVARHFRRAVFPAACAGIALIGYLFGHVRAMSEKGWYAAKAPIRDVLPKNIAGVWKNAPDELLLRDFASGAWAHGREVLSGDPIRTGVFVGITALALIAAAILWFRRSESAAVKADRTDASRPLDRLRLPLVACFGVLWIGFAWIPIVINHSVTMPRLHYVPDIGLAIVGAVVAQWLATFLSRVGLPGAAARLLGGTLVLAAAVPFVVMMVAVQDGYRLRYQRDQSEAQQLAALFKDSAPPNTLFIPMRVESRVLDTGSWRFDLYFMSCWNWHYAAGWNLQQVFRRDDIYTVQAGFGVWMGVWAPLDGASVRDEAILVGTVARPLPVPNYTRNPIGAGRVVPWNRIVPFTVEKNGEVRVYTRVYYTPREGKTAADFVPEQVRRAMEKHALPHKGMTLRPIPAGLLRKPKKNGDDNDRDKGVNEPTPLRRRHPAGAPADHPGGG